MEKGVAVGVVLAAAVAGMAAAAVLYFVLVGTPTLLFGTTETASLAAWTWDFATIFGLLSGAHWAFAAVRRQYSQHGATMLAVKLLTVAMVILAVVLAITGDRWSTTIASLGAEAAVLVIAWLALTYFVAKG